MADRPYVFHGLTNAVCATCLGKVEAKITFEDDRVYMRKRCPDHGPEKVLVSTDIPWFHRTRAFQKPGQMPRRFHTPIRDGCPYDCGLCPDHEQHSCLTLVEITDSCNLSCPVCYAESSPQRTRHRSLAEVEGMLDLVVETEGEPDIVQISGGEPTIHPEFFAILDAARARPIKHLMVNTNGVRVARDPEFAARLAGYMPDFEVYLQFDAVREEPYEVLRGVPLLETKLQALDRLDELGVSTTLVMTVRKGLNDQQIGEVVDFALTRPSVRGVTLQPVQDEGRVEGYDPAEHRLTVSEVRARLLEQVDFLEDGDVLPVPCHPDCLAMAYALKAGDEVVPLTRLVGEEVLLGGAASSIVLEENPRVRDEVYRLFATNHSPESAATTLQQLLCCMPQVETPEDLGYENVFRILVVQFMDRHSLDVASVKRSCVHIAQPDGRVIPFDTFNIFYRGDREAELRRLRGLAPQEV